MRDKFRVVVTGWITRKNRTLIGKKEENPDHPIGGEWHLPGGHVDKGEDLEEAVKREIKEETSLDVDIHQLIDSFKIEFEEDYPDMLRIIYHCEATSSDAKAKDDLQAVQWVQPNELMEELKTESEHIKDRDRLRKFLEKLKKMPSI